MAAASVHIPTTSGIASVPGGVDASSGVAAASWMAPCTARLGVLALGRRSCPDGDARWTPPVAQKSTLGALHGILPDCCSGSVFRALGGMCGRVAPVPAEQTALPKGVVPGSADRARRICGRG